ncbi:MAG: hypothetical protein ACRDTT_24310 [Pseudonocardiaceae bacterium]
MIVLLAGHVAVLAEAVDTTVDVEPVATLCMEALSLVGVPGGLSCSEVAPLLAGNTPQDVATSTQIGQHLVLLSISIAAETNARELPIM